MSRKIICYIMSLVILLSVLPITVSAEEIPIIGYIEVFSDIDNTERKIKALNNEETIFVSAEDISLITGYDLEIDEFINYSKAGGLDNVTAVDIEFDGAVSAMGKNFEVHIVNYEEGIYLPLLQMLYLLHAQWWISEDKLVIRSLPYTIIDFLGSENYEAMWKNKVNQTDLLINGESKLAHALRTSLAAVFNDFDSEIFVLWWPGEGFYPFINEEYEEALLQIAIDDMDFLDTYNQESMVSILKGMGFSDIESEWDNMTSIIGIPSKIDEGIENIDDIIGLLSRESKRNGYMKSNKYFDFSELDFGIFDEYSDKIKNISDVVEKIDIVLKVVEVSQRSKEWGEQYISQIKILTDFDNVGYNKSVTDQVKKAANNIIEEYQNPIKAAANEAAMQAVSYELSGVFDNSIFGTCFAIFNGGLAIAKTNENVRNDMDAADLAYMVDCLVKIEQIAMKEMSRSYSKLLDTNITGNFTQSDLERLRNCTMLSLRINLRNRAFLYYLNLRLNDDNNWENSIYAKNIQQQIVEDYARICLLMETEKSDSLLWIDDFENIYSNEYGLIREQLTLDIFHEGEIVDEIENYNGATEAEQEIFGGEYVELIGTLNRREDGNLIVKLENPVLFHGDGASYIVEEVGLTGTNDLLVLENILNKKVSIYGMVMEANTGYHYSDVMIVDGYSTLKVLEVAHVKRINYYIASDTCTSYVLPIYDEEKEIGGQEYLADGQKRNSYIYEYDGNGNMIKETWLNPDGTLNYWNEYDYNDLRNKLRGRHYSSNGDMNYYFEYQYNEKGQCVLEIRYDPYGTEQLYFENEFDENKLKVKSTLYNSSSGNKTHWIEFEYDLNGNCINETWYEISGVVMQRIEKLYEIDSSQAENNSNTDIETTITQIKNWYNDTQNNIGSLPCKIINDTIKGYYSKDGYILKALAVKGYNGSDYAREYYYHDNQLYFAFIYDGSDERRLYFNNGKVVRYIDNNGTVFDNNDTANFREYVDEIEVESEELKNLLSN